MTNLQLLKKLMSVPSPVNSRSATHALLDLVLAEFDEKFTIEKFRKNDVRSALVYVGPSRPAKFRMILNVHLDVIPVLCSELYKMKRNGSRVYGAGILDMKAGAAVVINVFRDMATRVDFPLGLQITTDEEEGGLDGTRWQIEQGVCTDFVLTSEPTNFEIVHKAKGVFQCEITAKGRSAHSAYPWRGDNALWRMNRFLDQLHQEFINSDSDEWKTTLNLSSISTSNQAFNKIPDEAIARLDVRFIAEDAARIVSRLEKHLDKNMILKVLLNEPAMNSPAVGGDIATLSVAASDILGKAIVLRGANGSSDARHFVATGSVGVEFGPVGGNIGSDNEWVDLSSLDDYDKILRRFLSAFVVSGKL